MLRFELHFRTDPAYFDNHNSYVLYNHENMRAGANPRHDRGLQTNPHWQLWEKQPHALVIFSGAHAYISSSWYEKETVSTWNYLAVHVYGTIRIVEDEKLFESLKTLTNKYEAHQEKPLYFEQFEESGIRKMMRGIIGFEIEIDRIEAKAKLSQNRNDKDYQNIVQQLHKTADTEAHEIADEMSKRRNLQVEI